MGLSCADIAGAVDISKQAIHSKIKRLRIRFLKTMVENPFFGWFHVYLEEIHRN
jgi:hypothetical protein